MQYTIGTVGSALHFTAQIPTDVSKVLDERGGDRALELTPDWGQVPEITVRRLIKAGLDIPSHWKPQDVVVPIIHGQAFYIGNIGLGGGAVSFSMKGVNLRTGKPETEGPLSDSPSQSYWAPGVSLPWIDGYVPSDGQAVRQFVPRKGEAEMATDVARHVGISDDDPYIDALRGRFFAPLEPKNELSGRSPYDDYLGGGLLGGPVAYAAPASFGGGMKSFSGGLESMGPASYGGVRAASVTPPVGMGAGARMRQRHEHNPNWTADDFWTTPWIDMAFRLIWVEEWNQLAQRVSEPLVTETRLAALKRHQHEYETGVRRRFGIFPKVDTDVDGFPKF